MKLGPLNFGMVHVPLVIETYPRNNRPIRFWTESTFVLSWHKKFGMLLITGWENEEDKKDGMAQGGPNLNDY